MTFDDFIRDVFREELDKQEIPKGIKEKILKYILEIIKGKE